MRWRRVVAVAVVAFAAAAVWGWLVWLPAHRPGLSAGERLGVDVSHHQGPIDWQRVAADGITFAYLKATEGGDFTDEAFAANWSGTGAAGLDRGAYHFFTLCTPGAEQADHFLDVLPDDRDTLPAAIDLELAGNCADRPDRSEALHEIRSFIESVEDRTGHPVVIYLGDDFEARYDVGDALGRPLWLPRLLLRPGGDWLVWQTSAFASVDGITGHVDLDVMRT
jgi:lysozyme